MKVQTVISRTGEIGKPTGGQRPCTLEGCLGIRIRVRWKGGKITWPCTHGMSFKKNTATIR